MVNAMLLTPIGSPDLDVVIDLAYAGANNFTGQAIYLHQGCFLHAVAAEKLAHAASLAGQLGYRLKIFDAFRPAEAQWRLWLHTPDADFLAPPWRGSPHSRGVAVDLTLIDGAGNELDMGTPFDALTPLAHHDAPGLVPQVQRNRHLLLGLMSTAGWGFYFKEWWHYQLFEPRRYPLLSDRAAGTAMMAAGAGLD